SFYGWSGYFGELSPAEYAARVAKYFPPYLASAMAYVAAATAFEALVAYASRLKGDVARQ
ncbi:MAG: hypothetical protein WD886_10785, partial [Burkholderiales bacterium]